MLNIAFVSRRYELFVTFLTKKLVQTKYLVIFVMLN